MMMTFLKRLFTNNRNEMSFKQGMDLVELPIVTFSQGETKLNFLLDTGSNNSIIDSNILDKIEHTMLESKSNLYGLDGINHTTNICRITMSCQNQDYEYEYIIHDMSEPFNAIKQETGVNLHGLLGSKFFNKFRYVLDFDELIAYSKK